MIRVRVHDEQSRARMQKIKTALHPSQTKPVLQRVALSVLRRLVINTPKGFTGQTRKSWQIAEIRNGYSITNQSKVMLYLEQGTRSHGPTQSKYLYIPLKASAMIWRSGLKFGTDYVLAKRVRGIRAIRLVERTRPVARRATLMAMKAHLRGAM